MHTTEYLESETPTVKIHMEYNSPLGDRFQEAKTLQILYREF